MKLRIGIFSLIAGLALSACSTAVVSSSNPPSLYSLRHMLITRADYPAGWNVTTSTRGSELDSTCAGVESEKQLLGSRGVSIFFTQQGDRTLSFEYLAYRRATIKAFEKAITPVMTFGSCRDETYGHVVDSSVGDGTIVTRNYGDWSTANLITSTIHGRKYQLGYMFVRKAGFLMIIGYENPGSLHLMDLEGLTQKAVSRITSN